MKGYVLWRRDASPVVRRDREGDDRLRLVASLEDLVPLGAEIAGLVIDDDTDTGTDTGREADTDTDTGTDTGREAEDASPSAASSPSPSAAPSPSPSPSAAPDLGGRSLAPVVPLFSADRPARRRRRLHR